MSKNKLHIKRGDQVTVISGKDKGATSVVMKTIPSSRKVIVEKVAVAKKAQRPSRDNPQGGIISIEKPIHISTVMLICPQCDKATRVKVDVRGKDKIRVCKKCGKDID
ncbi:MAG: 50S ribosomal protein L24 [Coriobacteriia bacterium]|nr:50S ribosomal protein L24 [Coriobacteriia bacterium]